MLKCMSKEKFFIPIPKKISDMSPTERRKFSEDFINALREHYLESKKQKDTDSKITHE